MLEEYLHHHRHRYMHLQHRLHNLLDLLSLDVLRKHEIIRMFSEFHIRRDATYLTSPSMDINWRQIWQAAGRESDSPELLGSPRTFPEVPRTSPEVFGDFPGSSLTVELNSNPEVPRKFPKLPRKFPKLPRKFRDFPGGQPLSLGSLTPSRDSQKLL